MTAKQNDRIETDLIA